MAVVAVLVPLAAQAEGGSYNVDDASVAGAGTCQLESWLRAWSNGTNGVYAAPACGIGPVELGVTLNTGQHLRGIGANPGIKWQLRNGDDKGVGVALEANGTYLRGRQDDLQAYVATTFGLDDARRLMVAVNIGADRDHRTRSHPLYGVGLDLALTRRVTLLVERVWTYRTTTDQGGVRVAFGESSLDLVVGGEREAIERPRHGSHWINLGWNAAF
ncbi:hypothetical protein [Luteibacter yeojuensis]|uniref:Outer membrane protein beta-barrel domain-containing protein n=1 Tax=Luteibacter yeojuensis TaxID=345309 RepID=A0A0F3K428_9GAMM|nr:hypothetical protein [Luteibacter yeojuensis]KJV24844.1 hypothetical protein VI08_20225 [Luteibacter yeojuensis]